MKYRLNKNLIVHSPTLVEFDYDDSNKAALKAIWVFLGVLVYGFDLFLWKSEIDTGRIFTGDIGSAILCAMAHAIPVLCFILWHFAKPNYSFIDRTRAEFIKRYGDQEIRFPGSTIEFVVREGHSKGGTFYILEIMAWPPFPEGAIRRFGRSLARKRPDERVICLGTISHKRREVIEAYRRFFTALLDTDFPPDELFRKTLGWSGDDSSPWKCCELLRHNRYGMVTLLGSLFFIGQALLFLNPDGQNLDGQVRTVWWGTLLPMVLLCFILMANSENRRRPELRPEEKWVNLGDYQLVGGILALFFFPYLEVLNATFDRSIQRDTAYVRHLGNSRHPDMDVLHARILNSREWHDLRYLHPERKTVSLKDTVEITIRTGLLGGKYRSDPVRVLGKCREIECF